MDEERDKIDDGTSTTYDHVLKYTGLFGGVQGVSMLMNIVRNKLVALLLGPEGAGFINMFNSVIKLINEATNFGVPFSAVKHIAEINETGDIDQRNHYACIIRTWSLFAGLLGMSVLIFLSYFISFWTFGDHSYTNQLILLSPAIACIAIAGGESAILKGTQHLKKLALVYVFSSIAALAVCAPIYFFFGIEGIPASLLLTSISSVLIHLYYSKKVIGWHVSLFEKNTYLEGMPMVKLGLVFIIAGIFSQGAEYFIRILMQRWGGLGDVGLYNTGYVMIFTYATLIFQALETDYFPRLSAIKNDTAKQNATVNQQIEVCSLLMSPILVMFVIAMPLIVIVLFSHDFVTAVPMAIFASFYSFFKSLTSPVAYLALAHGDSKMYMLTEFVYDIFIVLAIPFAYRNWGLSGTGIALSIAGFVDLIVIHAIYRIRYDFRFSTRLMYFYISQFFLLLAAVWFSTQHGGWIKLFVDAIIFCVSAGMSIHILRRETRIMSSLKEKFGKKFGRKRFTK